MQTQLTLAFPVVTENLSTERRERSIRTLNSARSVPTNVSSCHGEGTTSAWSRHTRSVTHKTPSLLVVCGVPQVTSMIIARIQSTPEIGHITRKTSRKPASAAHG